MLTYKQKQIRNIIYTRHLRHNPTKEELIIKRWLKENNINHRFQKGLLIPFHRIPDFYIPKVKILIEIDGGYHLNTVEKDKNKDEIFLEKRGMRTIRITNDEVNNGTFINKLNFLLEGEIANKVHRKYVHKDW